MFKFTIKHYLLIANLLLVSFLIIFRNLGQIPFSSSDFIFIVFLSLAFSLYRPGWAFLLLVGTLPIENLSLAPESWPLSVRPYQLLGLSIGISLLVRFFWKKINFTFPKWHFTDYLVIVLVLASFWSAFLSEEKALAFKLSLVIASFAFIYLLGRIYLQEIADLKRIVPIFLGSSFIISSYGIWQNWRFTRGLEAFEIMPGRPNATFAEPDWLGIYLVLIVSLAVSLIYFFFQKNIASREKISNFQPASPAGKFSISKQFITFQFLNFIFLTLGFSLLIATVSRSAWAGAIISILVALFLILTNLRFNFKKWQGKIFGQILVMLLISLFLSAGIVHIFNLTTFELGKRLESSTGEQKITLACDDERALPEKIASLEELPSLSCRHIDLENVESEKQSGKFIREILRPDPNINVRARIYQTSWNIIQSNWIAGIGWGNIGKFLGTDERGTALNASNIFLEVYLGSGLIGFLAFLILGTYILLRNVWKFFFAQSPEHKTLALFVITAFLGLLVSNLFNSAFMLGFMWLFLVIGLIRK
ncbi:MAG: O-antigen ligase family protein [Patescibacteria group bacterium]